MEGMSGWASVTLPGLREREEKARNGPSQIENSLFFKTLFSFVFSFYPLFSNLLKFLVLLRSSKPVYRFKKIYIYIHGILNI
jgi:hypothetical protein